MVNKHEVLVLRPNYGGLQAKPAAAEGSKGSGDRVMGVGSGEQGGGNPLDFQTWYKYSR